MTLKEYIEELTQIAAEEAREIEVVATGPTSRETYTPVITLWTGSDGVRYLGVA